MLKTVLRASIAGWLLVAGCYDFDALTRCYRSDAADCREPGSPAPARLIGYWKFDEASGSMAADSSGNDHIGLLRGSPTFVSGRIGNALDFRAGIDAVTIGGPVRLTNLSTYTIVAWIYPRSFGGAQLARIADKRDPGKGWTWFFCNTGGPGCMGNLNFRQTFTVAEGLWASSDQLALNVWQHVAVAYSNRSIMNNPSFYINGALMPSIRIEAPVGAVESDAAQSMTLGNTSSGERGFDGLIDEVRIYDGLLTSQEIAELYRVAALGY